MHHIDVNIDSIYFNNFYFLLGEIYWCDICHIRLNSKSQMSQVKNNILLFFLLKNKKQNVYIKWRLFFNIFILTSSKNMCQSDFKEITFLIFFSCNLKFFCFQHISSSKHRKRINATNAALNCRSEAYHYSSATPGAQQCFHGSSNTQERPCPHFTKVNNTALGPAIHRCWLVHCTPFIKIDKILLR